MYEQEHKDLLLSYIQDGLTPQKIEQGVKQMGHKVTAATIYNFVNGKNSMTFKTFDNIMSYLNTVK